jgi:hypothetical protein
VKLSRGTMLPVFAFVVGISLAGTSNSGILYVTQYNGTNGAIIDTDANVVLNTFTTTTNTQTAIAVGDTLRIMAGQHNQSGSEYDLNGNVINSGIYPNEPAYDSFYDGTTDGLFNYAIDHNANGFNQVFRFDRNWANGVGLFRTRDNSSGITYDAATNTLWTTEATSARGQPDGLVRQYALDGTFLSEFDKGLAELDNDAIISYGIAWDGTDDTLWVTDHGTNTSILHHYAKDGTKIGTSDFGGTLFGTLLGVEENPFGIEFQMVPNVPIPASLPLFLSGLGILGVMRWRSKIVADGNS